MVLELSNASLVDVDRIADIHLAAFSSNILLHAQFPTVPSLASLRSVLIQEMLHAIETTETARKAVLVVRDSEANGQIISFAKWDLPGVLQDPKSHVLWHEDVRQEYLEDYLGLAGAAKDRVIGDAACYRLTFIGTDPAFQGRGAASLLTEWGLSRSKRDNIPIYLESTTTALPLYRKLGFVALDGFSMTLPGAIVEEGPKVYEELCMLRSWDDDQMSGMDRWDSSLNISSLTTDYEIGIKPQHVVQAVYDRIDAYNEVQSSVWIYLHPIGEVMKAAHGLYTRWPNPTNRPPLWGIPFSVKDNIDVAGIPTTVGCPALAFTPTSSAPVYQRCIDAGGLFIGKTNMEQLATGMTGCRSPYGTLHSTFSDSHIVGGSSSGSAVTVSGGLVSFSLGSDTAGSIRLPALYNGVVGFKPTKGTVSTSGVYPASRHQDSVSFLAANIHDAETVWKVCRGFDKRDVFSKRPSLSYPQCHSGKVSSAHFGVRFGVPPNAALEQCSPEYRRKFAQVVEILKARAGEPVTIDWAPFSSANDLLYSSSFVLERLTILPGGWFEENKQLLHPVTKQVLEGALTRNSSAVDLFRDLHKQAECKRAVEEMLACDHDAPADEDIFMAVVVPTAPFHPTIAEVEDDPIGLNVKLGAFAQFANVLDLVGVAIPCGTYDTDDTAATGVRKTTLPFGVTILAGAGFDEQLSILAKDLEEVLGDLHDEGQVVDDSINLESPPTTSGEPGPRDI
ncbi:Amidase signature enzyme [Venustampulla echinocandica]|uniref:Amidase signature enzyme n=1 Tax=Venustampulla echinocandica TaxID=2656787 RepID=A0A370U2P6_9HELO|nr:Amidase signature enzyme [Venustampulla echinocandica]RDL42058.1 Amidase signature enzyme [Venustampulla echinocandica]